MPDMSDKEWRELILSELRDLRRDFQEFKYTMATEISMRKGRQTILTAVTSAAVSLAVAVTRVV